MPDDKKIALWKRLAAYSAFVLFSAVAAFFLTFPYETLKERVRTEADSYGYFAKIGSLGPGFFSVRASKIEISKKLSGATDEKAPEPLQIDSVSVSPSLFPLGVAVTAKALGGSVWVKAGGLTQITFKFDAEELDLSKGNLKGFTGIDFAGTLDAEGSLTMPRISVGAGPSQPDLGAATGTVMLKTQALSIKGGVIDVPAEAYDQMLGMRRGPSEGQPGGELIPFDVPNIPLGDFNARLKFVKGAGTVEEFRGKSTGLEVAITGTLKLAKRLEYSEPNLEVRFKPEPEFQKGLGVIGGGLAAVAADPKDPSWRMGRLTGFLGRPNFR